MQRTTLSEEASNILHELDLLTLLNEFGDAEVVGSVALDLIVKLDIDIHVLVKNGTVIECAKQLSEILLNKTQVREVRLTDYSEKDSLKLTIDQFPAKSGNWSIDIWLTSDYSTTGFEDTKHLSACLATEHRESILKIKRHYHELGQLRDGISVKIYRAVLNDGVRSVEDFEQLATS